MTFDLQVVRAQYVAERPAYERLAERVRNLLVAETREGGIRCEVQARVKEVDSFLKKALRPGKGYRSPLDEIRDKAGVRVVATYAEDLREIRNIISKLFVVHNGEDKRDDLGYDQLGYRGVHYEVGLPDGDKANGDDGLGDLLCEIQLHTAAEHLWADVSHHLLYKAPRSPDPPIQRSVYRLVALVELFDKEVTEAREAILGQPEYREAMILDTLEGQYYRLTGRPYDRELSREIANALRPLLDPEEVDRFDSLMRGFVDRNADKLQGIFHDYAADERVDLVLFQPESLLVFERLEKDPFKLKAAWSKVLSPTLLESLASVWGRSI